jgi:hypothetical protein
MKKFSHLLCVLIALFALIACDPTETTTGAGGHAGSGGSGGQGGTGGAMPEPCPSGTPDGTPCTVCGGHQQGVCGGGACRDPISGLPIGKGC